jgi:hypothetical protein
MQATNEWLLNYAISKGVVSMILTNPTSTTPPVFPKDYSFTYKGGIIPYYTAARQMLMVTDPDIVQQADASYTAAYGGKTSIVATPTLSKKVLGLETKYWLLFGVAFIGALFYIKRK